MPTRKIKRRRCRHAFEAIGIVLGGILHVCTKCKKDVVVKGLKRTNIKKQQLSLDSPPNNEIGLTIE